MKYLLMADEKISAQKKANEKQEYSSTTVNMKQVQDAEGKNPLKSMFLFLNGSFDFINVCGTVFTKTGLILDQM